MWTVRPRSHNYQPQHQTRCFHVKDAHQALPLTLLLREGRSGSHDHPGYCSCLRKEREEENADQSAPDAALWPVYAGRRGVGVHIADALDLYSLTVAGLIIAD